MDVLEAPPRDPVRPTKELVERANAARKQRAAEEWAVEQFWQRVGMTVGARAGDSPERLRELYGARLCNVAEADWPTDPDVTALELLLAAVEGRMVQGRTVARDAAQRDADAERERLEAEARLRRPPLSPDRPLYATALQAIRKLGGRDRARGETVDLGEMHWQPGKLEALRRLGLIGAHPEHPSDIETAITLSAVGGAAVTRDAPAFGGVPTAERHAPEPEDASERRRQADRERQRRYRARRRAEVNV